jgi:protein-tyrosine phosphatase
MVICTSHFIPGTAWAASREIVLEKMAAVQDCFDSNAVDVTLLPGMEIAFHCKLVERLEHGQLLSLAGSSRFLVEPSFNDGVDELLDTLEILTGRGYGIILAHPERIPAIQEMAEAVAGFVLKHGVEIQLNAGSLLGKFGDDSRRTALRLIERECVQYLGTDAHGAEARRPPDAAEWGELERIVGGDRLRLWCCVHPAGLVRGE